RTGRRDGRQRPLVARRRRAGCGHARPAARRHRRNDRDAVGVTGADRQDHGPAAVEQCCAARHRVRCRVLDDLRVVAVGAVARGHARAGVRYGGPRVLAALGDGFAAFAHPTSSRLDEIGDVLGTLVGVLPGIGPIGAMSVLLGVTTQLGPTGSLILFAGIYFGSTYGGSTTSILLNVPGEASSVVTALEAYEMTKRGRSGP